MPRSKIEKVLRYPMYNIGIFPLFSAHSNNAYKIRIKKNNKQLGLYDMKLHCLMINIQY